MGRENVVDSTMFSDMLNQADLNGLALYMTTLAEHLEGRSKEERPEVGWELIRAQSLVEEAAVVMTDAVQKKGKSPRMSEVRKLPSRKLQQATAAI